MRFTMLTPSAPMRSNVRTAVLCDRDWKPPIAETILLEGSLFARSKRRNLPVLQAVEHEGEGSFLMELWKDASLIVIVDAANSGSVTGHDPSLRRPPSISAGQIRNVSTHAFGLAQAVEF